MVPNQVSIGKSVFAATVSQSLHRSALFLLAFLVVHLFGNMAVFFGPEVFNGYGHKLRHNPLLLVVEYYLLAAVVVHAIAAGFGTWRKRKMIAKKPAANGKLMFSAIVVTAFLVTHLLDLRFGSEELKYTQADGSLTRDLYSLQLSLFQNKGRVLWYLVAIAAVGILSRQMRQAPSSLYVLPPTTLVDAQVYVTVVVATASAAPAACMPVGSQLKT